MTPLLTKSMWRTAQRGHSWQRLPPSVTHRAPTLKALERWQSPVDCSCLESSRPARARGFESLPLRVARVRRRSGAIVALLLAVGCSSDHQPDAIPDASGLGPPGTTLA